MINILHQVYLLPLIRGSYNFNPTYDFLDYVANTDNNKLISMVFIQLLFNDNLEKISHFVRRLVWISSRHAMNLLRATMDYYSRSWYNVDPVTYKDMTYYKVVLSTIINDVKSHINLRDIADLIIRQFVNDISKITIVRFDALLYTVFEMIDDYMLKHTDNDVLETLVLLSIKMSVSDILTETLLKYLEIKLLNSIFQKIILAYLKKVYNIIYKFIYYHNIYCRFIFNGAFCLLFLL